MGIHYVLLVSKQGKLRLSKWYMTTTAKERTKLIKDITHLVLSRRPKSCNFIDYKDHKIIYRRYASLYFITGIDTSENELITLEVMHRFVEVLDKYFGNVCELDLIFNFQKAYWVLDEVVMGGELQESSKKAVLRAVAQQDQREETERMERQLQEFA